MVEEGIARSEDTEQVLFWKYLHVEKAMIALAGARWEDARQWASLGVDGTSPVRSSALSVLGRVALRTGHDDPVLRAEALALGRQLDELQRVGPATVLSCEAAWLAGDLSRVVTLARPAYDEAVRLRSVPWIAELGYWLTVAGVPGVAPQPGEPGADHPYALHARGDWAGAADRWGAAGYPYEEAVALADSPDPAVVLDALSRLDALGARPAADVVRRRLQALGVRRVPRGPSPATRTNVAGLTSRQLEVLALVSDGLPNTAIAERLVLSVRTVDHHVEALLHKLDASSRAEAVSAAVARGWTPPAPVSSDLARPVRPG